MHNVFLLFETFLSFLKYNLDVRDLGQEIDEYVYQHISIHTHMYYLATKTRNHIDCIPNQNAVLDIIMMVEKLYLISDLSFIEGTRVPFSEIIWIFKLLKSCSVQA